MAFSRRNLQKRQKGVKWINTRFAKHYKAARAIHHDMGIRSMVVALSQAAAIRSQPASNPAARVLKATALAECIIAGHQTYTHTMQQFHTTYGSP